MIKLVKTLHGKMEVAINMSERIVRLLLWIGLTKGQLNYIGSSHSNK